MSDGITDRYNLCPLCGERLFGHDYVKCVKCLIAMHEQIEEAKGLLEQSERKLRAFGLKALPLAIKTFLGKVG